MTSNDDNDVNVLVLGEFRRAERTVRVIDVGSHLVFFFILVQQERQELLDLASVMLGYEKEPQSMP